VEGGPGRVVTDQRHDRRAGPGGDGEVGHHGVALLRLAAQVRQAGGPDGAVCTDDREGDVGHRAAVPLSVVGEVGTDEGLAGAEVDLVGGPGRGGGAHETVRGRLGDEVGAGTQVSEGVGTVAAGDL